ncbi:MAG: spore germination protein [Clostridiales bacterium]|nr:spore germination protein [Clostridiales bacterium]
MLHDIFRKIGYLIRRSQQPGNAHEEAPDERKLFERLELNKERIQSYYGNDLVLRACNVGSRAALLCYIDGLADEKFIGDFVLVPLLRPWLQQGMRLSHIKEHFLTAGDVKETDALPLLLGSLSAGDCALLLDGEAGALLISSKGYARRGVEDSTTEMTARGPRESFTENMRTNTALLRRRVKSPDLLFDLCSAGRYSKTDITIAYIRGIAQEETVAEVKRRLAKIDVDAVLESGYVEQYVEDAPYSLFATVGNSERPDAVAARLLEGRIAILVDGTPFVLTVPCFFMETFQGVEDYYARPFFATFLRVLRFAAAIVTVLLPALYLSFTIFHQEIIPTKLLFSMVGASANIPFPELLEMLLMSFTFEVLREAGKRLPRAVGQSISIVGAIIVGEAAVSAGLVSAPMVIVVSFTAVCSFMVPAHNDAFTLLRFIFIAAAGWMGGVGVLLCALCLLAHLASLESFGQPYMAPFFPLRRGDLKDSLVRAPLHDMVARPTGMTGNRRRVGGNK